MAEYPLCVGCMYTTDDCRCARRDAAVLEQELTSVSGARASSLPRAERGGAEYPQAASPRLQMLAIDGVQIGSAVEVAAGPTSFARHLDDRRQCGAPRAAEGRYPFTKHRTIAQLDGDLMFLRGTI